MSHNHVENRKRNHLWALPILSTSHAGSRTGELLSKVAIAVTSNSLIEDTGSERLSNLSGATQQLGDTAGILALSLGCLLGSTCELQPRRDAVRSTHILLAGTGHMTQGELGRMLGGREERG